MEKDITKFKFDKALNRLAYTISNSNKPNKTDVDAFNNIVKWFNVQESKTIDNNKLFAKLYILFLTQTLRHYKASVFDLSILNTDLHKKLDTDLDMFYFAFREDLIHRQLDLILNNPKGNITTDKFTQEVEEFKKKYNQEYVNQKLNEMINGALVNFS